MTRIPKLAGLAAALAMVAGAAQAQVVVSSKIDTEGGVLGNIILEVLGANGIETENRLQLGGTPIVRQAIISGEIDIYPEYTGNAAFFFNEADSAIWKDAAEGASRAAELDLAANKIVWLSAAPANNTWAIAVRDDLAKANDLKSMSDLGRFIAAGGTAKLAASTEFVTAPAALPAFQSTYGFTLQPDQIVQLSGGDTAATIAAAAQQTSGVNMAMVYGTDGALPSVGLMVLEDDKSVQPVYQPAPIVREAVLTAHPEIATVLAPIFASLDLVTLQGLNGRVQVGGEPAASVARDYLTRNGFIK